LQHDPAFEGFVFFFYGPWSSSYRLVARSQLPAALPKPLKNKKAAVLLQQPFFV